MLLNAGASVGICCDTGMSPLYAAVAMRRLETADLLLSAGANVADVHNKRTLLVEAATQGNLVRLSRTARCPDTCSARIPPPSGTESRLGSSPKIFAI